MDRYLMAFLTSRTGDVLARLLLTFPFWRSGLSKLVYFDAGVSGMQQFGMEPAMFVNIAVFSVQLLGSALIIMDRLTWLGSGMLGIFTLLTIPLVHHYWSLQGVVAISSFNTAMEHIGLVGGLLSVSMLSALKRSTVSWPAPAP